jgi:hypothetical protein
MKSAGSERMNGLVRALCTLSRGLTRASDARSDISIVAGVITLITLSYYVVRLWELCLTTELYACSGTFVLIETGRSFVGARLWPATNMAHVVSL